MFTLFRLELKYNIKRLSYLIQIYVFFAISIFILLLNMKSIDTLTSTGILWILLIFVSLLSPVLRWDEELQNGYLEQWRLAPLTMETIVISRLLAHVLGMLAPLILLTLAMRALLPENEGEGLLSGMGGTMLAVGLCAGSVVQFTAALTRDAGRAAGIMGILAMPLIIPAILFASYSHTGSTIDGNILLASYTAFIVPMSIMAASASLRSSH